MVAHEIQNQPVLGGLPAESVYALPKYKRDALIAFTLRLNQPPKGEHVLKHPVSKTDYLPISHIQTTLDEIFPGQWWEENFRTQVIGNEIAGSIELVVVNPVTGREIRHVGAAAVLIRQASGAKVTDIDAKIKNALEGDFPHLKSDCLKNAAKMLGKVFGRDLNRKYDDTYSPGAAMSFNDLDEWQGQINERTKALRIYQTYLDKMLPWNRPEHFSEAKQLVFEAKRDGMTDADVLSLQQEINDAYLKLLSGIQVGKKLLGSGK